MRIWQLSGVELTRFIVGIQLARTCGRFDIWLKTLKSELKSFHLLSGYKFAHVGDLAQHDAN